MGSRRYRCLRSEAAQCAFHHTAPSEVIISLSSFNFNSTNWNILVPITVTGVVDTSSVTFMSVDWSTPHTVRVTGVDDAIVDPDMF
jgi:hypothetical protein